MTAAPSVVRQECGRKGGRYASERGALRRLERIRARGEDPDRLIHAYLCPHCGGWHLGHRPGIGRRPPDAHDGLSAAMKELLLEVAPWMRRSTWAPQRGWYLGWLGQDASGRWQAQLQGPTRAKQVWSNRNCPTAAAAIRDLVAKARASRWYAPEEIGGRNP